MNLGDHSTIGVRRWLRPRAYKLYISTPLTRKESHAEKKPASDGQK